MEIKKDSFELKVDVQLASLEESKKLLLSGENEIIMGYIYKQDGKDIFEDFKDFQCITLFSNHYCCRVSNESLLSKYMSISLKTALKNTIGHFSMYGGEKYKKIIQAYAGEDENIDMVVYKNQLFYREQLINGGKISIIPDIPYKDRSQIEYIHGTVDIPIKENIVREFCIIHQKNKALSENAMEFIQLITNYIAYNMREY